MIDYNILDVRAVNERKNKTANILHEQQIMVQNRSNYDNKTAQSNSNAVTMMELNTISSKSVNNLHYINSSESNRLEYKDDKVPQSDCKNTVNCSFHKVRGRSRTTFRWSNTMHNVQALFMCFALIALGLQNILVSANTVVPIMTPIDESSINDPAKPINMTTLIRNQIAISDGSVSENKTKNGSESK